MRQAARSLFAAAVGAAVARGGLRAANGHAHGKAGDDGVDVGKSDAGKADEGDVAASKADVIKAGADKAGAFDASRWDRTNHRGEPVTLLEGPIFAAAAAVGVLTAPGLPARLRAAGVTAVVGAGAFGVYDDLCGNADRRGIKGHLTALTHGEVTTGGVKVVGIGAVGVLGGCLVRRGGGALDKALAAVVIAGAANAVNLLDLRPGRAIKGAALAAAPGMLRRAAAGAGAGRTSVMAGGASFRGGANILAAAGLGAAAALLPEDLGERAMLGDAGANALGALLGVAAAAGARSTAGLAWRAAALTAVTLASEKVSFTKVIAGCPPLNAVDMWGRRPSAASRVPAPPAGTGEPTGTAEDSGAAETSETAGTAGAAGSSGTAGIAGAAGTATHQSPEHLARPDHTVHPDRTVHDGHTDHTVHLDHAVHFEHTVHLDHTVHSDHTVYPGHDVYTDHTVHLDHDVHDECADKPDQSDYPAHSANSTHSAHPTATSADGPAGTGQEPDPRG